MIRSLFLTSVAALLFVGSAQAAQEFYVGEPVVQSGMQIVPNYLTGVEMDRHPDGMAMGKDAVHLEADVHATKTETHGFAEDAWIPYLTIEYTLTKPGSKFEAKGKLWPMTAKDGPHYANNVEMAGPGTYKLTYVIQPPSSNGFIRHISEQDEMMKRVVLAAAALMLASPVFADGIAVTLKDHKFMPAEIHVKANMPVVITLTNKDATAEEFDSTALKVEKVVAGNDTGDVHIRPLDPGRYPFMGEYHSATAQGVVIAQ
jgi:uncharacterized protein involved in high-affinity Fe2+ transport